MKETTKLSDLIILPPDVFIGGKTKCVKMNETLNQWKAL